MRVKVHPSFYIYLLCIALLSSLSVCIGALAALLIHEISHYIACKIANEQIDQLELTPFGGVMTYKPGSISSKGLKGVFVHAAGPIGNYSALVLCAFLAHSNIRPDFLYSMLAANISMLLLNLLPVFPLDGGHIVFCLGYYIFSISRLVSTLSSMGIIVGFIGILVSVYGLVFKGLLNCSLLIVSIHMMITAARQRYTMLAENVYTVVQERMNEFIRAKRVVQYQVAPDITLFELIGYLKQNVSVCFSFYDHACIQMLHEQAFCQALIAKPDATVREAFLNTQQYQEKNRRNVENTSFTP